MSEAIISLPSSTPPLSSGLSVENEAKIFWQLRLRMMKSSFRQHFSQSRFRIGIVVALSGFLWLGLFMLFQEGFQYVKTTIPNTDTHDQMVQAVLTTFFAALMLMLTFSSAVILYGALFRSREMGLLLTLPARVERIFLFRFQEALLLSSWGFLLIGTPILVAYGVVAEAPWYYYVTIGPYLFAFVYIAAAVGGICCLLIVYFLPRGFGWFTALGALVVLFVGAWYVWGFASLPRDDLLTYAWFQDMLNRLRLTEQRLLPNWWLSAGLLETARDEWQESAMFLGLIISNALFLRLIAAGLAGKIYRPALNRLHKIVTRPRYAHAGDLDDSLINAPIFIPKQMRLLLLKDLRIFTRDPMQWSQLLIFFSLLALYFFNIRRFNYDFRSVWWVNLVSFLNLSVVGLLMSTFTTRFIFPLVSLEGQRFWLLGLLPVSRNMLLWSKFLFAVGGSIIPCSSLILVSDLMLDVSTMIIWSHQLTCLLLCVGLAGISVGLGARLPNFREQSPTRISAGFGGTLSLVLSAFYILAIVLMTALPAHFSIINLPAPNEGAYAEHVRLFRTWLIAGNISSVFVGAFATFFPLWIGFRSFNRMEF